MPSHVSQSARLHIAEQTLLGALVFAFPKEILKGGGSLIDTQIGHEVRGSSANGMLKLCKCFTSFVNEATGRRPTLNKAPHIMHEGGHEA
jgi:hypothetical protein